MLKHANSALYIGAIVSFRWIPVSVFSEYRPAASGRFLPLSQDSKGRNQGSSAGSILTGYWMVFLVTAASILKPGQKNRRGCACKRNPVWMPGYLRLG